MKGTITMTFTAKEAVAMLANDTLPKSLTNKIVKAFRESNSVKPQGAKAAAIARTTTKTKKAKTDDTETTTTRSRFTGQEQHSTN